MVKAFPDVVTPLSDSDPDSDIADSILAKKIKNYRQHTRYEMGSSDINCCCPVIQQSKACTVSVSDAKFTSSSIRTIFSDCQRKFLGRETSKQTVLIVSNCFYCFLLR